MQNVTLVAPGICTHLAGLVSLASADSQAPSQTIFEISQVLKARCCTVLRAAVYDTDVLLLSHLRCLEADYVYISSLQLFLLWES